MRKFKIAAAVLMTAIMMCGCGDKTDTDKKESSSVESVVEQSESTKTSESTESTKSSESTESTESSDSTVNEDSSETADPEDTSSSSDIPMPTPKPEKTDETPSLEKIKFNPHVYVPMLAEVYSQEWWDSLYSFCDAIREGKDTFECSSQEIYDWVLDITTLAQLFPAAGGKVSGESTDGTVPFENGIGRIYYKIPVEDMVKREAEFEAVIEDILNTALESDDTDFEKIFKLYAYIAENYTYVDGVISDGTFSYTAFMQKKGVCDHIASNYGYLLLQAGIDAVEVGCGGNLDHAWNYVKLNGEGYHCDATWALHDKNVALGLWHFMNSATRRASFNVPMDTMNMPLLPGFFLESSELKLPATSDKFDCFLEADFISMDENKKILCYKDYDGVHELSYE